MTRLLSITFLTALLAACSSMGMNTPSSSMGNGADLQHSTDSAAAKTGNGAAVSPGGK